MATKDALLLYFSSLEKKTYYEILRLSPDARAAEIQPAFHAFSLLYHPDRYIEASKDVAKVAAEIYKRGVEAYRCLSRPKPRGRYDRALARGKLRIEPDTLSTRPPPPPMRTLEAIARTAQAKKFAERAERLIGIGRLADARVELASACQCEPDNAELAERLRLVYEALSLEPG